MAWRLGTLFAFMSARGSEIPSDKVAEAMALIRHMFPQKDMFAFTTPNKHNFIKLVESVEGIAFSNSRKRFQMLWSYYQRIDCLLTSVHQSNLPLKWDNAPSQLWGIF
jgi:hypothetical protein